MGLLRLGGQEPPHSHTACLRLGAGPDLGLPRPGGHPGGGGRAQHLEHGVGEEGLQRPLLAVRLGLIVLEQLVEVTVLFAVGQDLQAVLMVAHELLVDVEHGQQDVEQVSWEEGGGLSGQWAPHRTSAQPAPAPPTDPAFGNFWHHGPIQALGRQNQFQ